MINTYLDLSTAHLTARTLEQLQKRQGADNTPALGWPALTIANYPAGVFVSVPCLDLIGIAQMQNLPSDLSEVLRYAYRRGCYLVRFDADGDNIGLPIYERP